MQEFKLPEFTNNPNVVANMPVQEYFERKCKELGLERFPKVDFVAIPVDHTGSQNAAEVVSVAKKNNSAILLIENVESYAGNKDKLIKALEKAAKKEGFLTSPPIFYKELLDCAESSGVILDTYEYKRQTLEDVVSYVMKVHKSNKIFKGLDLRPMYKSGDIETALTLIKNKLFSSGGFFDTQTEREFLMLNNMGPRIFEMVSKNKKLLSLENLKVAYFAGAYHEEGLIDKMIERGDSLEIVRPKNFTDFKVKRENMSFVFLAAGFFGVFCDEVNMDGSILSPSNLYKYPKQILDLIIKAKKEKDPKSYFIEGYEKLVNSGI